MITQTEEELAQAQEEEEAQYELFCARVRDMEERGDRQLLVCSLQGHQLYGSVWDGWTSSMRSWTRTSG